MLSFQNLHQFVFNLSQATSAVSSTYIRLTSTSATKKPEIDVCCSTSFLNTLKSFEESGNLKLFEHLQNVTFGPKFENIQWIFKKDINFRLTATSSVNESNVYIVMNKKDLKSLYSMLNKSRCSKDTGSQLKEFLADFEVYMLDKPGWSESYISKKSFDENKRSFSCGSYNKYSTCSPVFSNLVGTSNSYSNKYNAFSVQRRGFKTKRILEVEEKASPGVFSKFGKNIRNQMPQFMKSKPVNYGEKITASPFMEEMMANQSTTPEDKLKLKASFAEGYMVAANDFKKPETGLARFFKYFWGIGAFILLVALLFPADGNNNFILQSEYRVQ